MWHYLYLFLAAFFAYIIKGITGFGNTLIMAPLFSFMLPNSTITPIDLLFSIPSNIFIVYLNRKNLSLKIIIPLSLMLLIGVIPGTFLLKHGNDILLKILLGIVIIGVAIEMWTRKPAKNTHTKPNPIFLTIIGIISGVLAGLYGISILLIAYISRTTNNRGQFRANLVAVFLVDNLFRLALYTTQGMMSTEVFSLTLYLFPAIMIGMFIGVKIDKRLSDSLVNKFVIILLSISGLTLLTTNLINYLIK